MPRTEDDKLIQTPYGKKRWSLIKSALDAYEEKPKEADYRQNAISDARDMADNFFDAILAKFLADNEVSDDYNNDYDNGDSFHHENHVDRDYDLKEACAIISQLDQFEETDKGLWEGKDMKEALATCAAFTYGCAVGHFWSAIIKAINEDHLLPDLKAEYEGIVTEASSKAGHKDKDALYKRIENRIKALIKEFKGGW